MDYYLKSVEETLNVLSSNPNGLDNKEVLVRGEKHGKNKLAEPPKISIFSRFMSQLADPMIIILICAAVVSAITSVYAGESFTDVFIIMFVVILNAVLGVVQENKAEKAIEALGEMSKATSKVYRNGILTHINSEDLVVGDIIVLEAGDAVPADARLIECASLKAEESALTGESVPVNKSLTILDKVDGKAIPLGDRTNMVYMGSTIAYGRGKAVIVEIGMQTEMGKIAEAITQAKDGKTPLQLKLAQLSKILTWIVLGICAFIFAFSVLRNGSFEGSIILDSFMVAVSLAVAAIPEGLAAVVTIVLSIGVTKMSARNAVIRKLTAVETLGCTQVICSDKTGTLTQNKMTVVDDYGYDSNLTAIAMALCSDAELDENDEAIGEPTECALVNFAKTLDHKKYDLEKRFPRVGEAPFDSMRKLMSTVHRTKVGFVQYTKGAPDELLKCCNYALVDGNVVAITEEIKKDILSANKAMADKALRVLACAKKEYEMLPDDFEPRTLENDLIFIGLTGMIDPIRDEVFDAIKKCREASIKPIMITGDHRDTAVAIAMQLGIITDKSQAITGAELDEISEEDFETEVEKYSVYARVQPEHKVRIVNAWKKKGKITAMTGDGVNDAPSIKSADIGVGMGITGTDVTKNVADMVLADDNFATIVVAVGEGRKIYDNIRKSIQFLLASNLSEVISIFTATVLGFTILHPVHILWINLITDTFPALALGMEEGEPDIMQRKPRESNEGIFADGLGIDVAYQGILVSILTLAAYFIGHYMESGVWEIANSADGITMAFLTMSMAEIFHSFNMRSQKKSIFSLPTHNKFLYAAMLASFILTAGVIYIPFLTNAFGFETISLAEYVVAMLLAVMIIPVVEIVKYFMRKKEK